MKAIMKASLIIASIFAFGIFTCLWVCVFIGINGEILASIITLSFGFLSAFLYGIIDTIRRKKETISKDLINTDKV